MPVISARQLLAWLDARNGSAFQSVVWSNNTQSFLVQATPNARGLQTMVPVPTGYRVSSLSYNSKPIPCSLRGVKGLQYACFPARSGAYQVSFAPDITPPTITAVFPPGGASNVSPAATVSAAFSEPISATALNSSTLALKDSLGNAVAATVSYNPFTLTATLTPLSPLALSTAYTVAIKGGAGGVTDAAGNPLATSFNSTFTTSGVYTLWPSTAAPGFVDAGPDGAAELGVRFRSDVAGTIAGIRFYKAMANTGVHVGNLWTSGGVLLATATFTGETASGWQQVNFSAPVSIASNTVYVASYHANGGHYSADGSYYLSQGVDNPPLHALASGLSGGNGVYHYGAGSTFPNLTYDAENYWVDVMFAPSAP